MAKVELSEETKAGIEEVREADLLIAVAVPVDTEQLRTAATQAILGTGQSMLSGLRTVVAFPGPTGVEAPFRRRRTSNRGKSQDCALSLMRCLPRQSRREYPGSRLPALIKRFLPWPANWEWVRAPSSGSI